MINRRDIFRLRMWTDDYNWDCGVYKMIYYVECRDYTQNTMLSVHSFDELLDNHEAYNIMLCTGIKDSNGKLIYENDIIEIKYNKHRTENYQVKYGKYITCGSSIPNIGFYIQNLEDNSIWSFYNKEKITIIGNIYETKEFMYLHVVEK